ncbi:MAG TPA: glycosyltransferase family 2 protein [Terriglobales bacterium]|jgi:glycosyltransferase involved in cell wall biosynthesis|nr:glycosyltransferase family 2 protein [Terriglobales bacterium]
MISVLILTRNEERDLPGCLQSVAWSDDVHVLDSFSSDRTCEIARGAGAKVTQRVFDDWSSHQNWALANIPFLYPWVFYLDADERVSPELASSLAEAVKCCDDCVAYRVRRRDFWGERWLKHAVASSFYLRLFRPEKMRYERLVNPLSIPDGPAGELDGYLDHHPFSKGISHWLDRHNSYSSFEAREASHVSPLNLRGLFSRDFNRRRSQQKELFYRLPARPALKFFLLYLGKLGFLDGAAGLRYALLQSFYEYVIVLKSQEIKRAAPLSASPVPLRDLHANPGFDD